VNKMKKKDEGSLFESQEMSFETALEKLEENVKKLEDGKIPLQDAMELFKESIIFVRKYTGPAQ